MNMNCSCSEKLMFSIKTTQSHSLLNGFFMLIDPTGIEIVLLIMCVVNYLLSNSYYLHTNKFIGELYG